MPLELRFTEHTTTFKGYDNREHSEQKGCLRKAFNGVTEIVMTGDTLGDLFAAIIRPPSNIFFTEVLNLQVFSSVVFPGKFLERLLVEYTHPDLATVINRYTRPVPCANKDAYRHYYPEMTYETSLLIAQKCGFAVPLQTQIIRFDDDYRVIDPDRMRQVGLEAVFANYLLKHDSASDRMFAVSPNLQSLFNEYLLSIIDAGECKIMRKYSAPGHKISAKKYTQDFYNLSWNVSFSETDIGTFDVIVPDLPEPVTTTPESQETSSDILARIAEISHQLEELKAAFGGVSVSPIDPTLDPTIDPMLIDPMLTDPMLIDPILAFDPTIDHTAN